MYTNTCIYTFSNYIIHTFLHYSSRNFLCPDYKLNVLGFWFCSFNFRSDNIRGPINPNGWGSKPYPIVGCICKFRSQNRSQQLSGN